MPTSLANLLISSIRTENLRRAANRAARALAETPNPAARKRAADHAIGFWLSAALDDKQSSERFKHDVREWFAANEQLADATKLAKLLAIAEINLRAVDRANDPVPARVGEATDTIHHEPVPIRPTEYVEGDVITVRRGREEKRYIVLKSGPHELTPLPKQELKRKRKRKRKYHNETGI